MESYSNTPHISTMHSSWLSFILLLLFFSFSFDGVSGARHRKHHRSDAIVVGTVYCDTCFRQQVSKSTHFISGAKVAVECGGDGLKTFRQEVKTNEKGEFEAKLPVSIGKHVDRIKNCAVKLISSSEPYCSVAATATSSEIQFKSKKAGTHIFSAGFFTFKPELCSQKDLAGKGFPPALPDPATPFLPPIGEGILPPLPVPDLPVPPVVPSVPPVPRIPGIPIPPVSRQKPSESKPSESDDLSDEKIFGFPFPPNPLAPPTLPPLPFVPAPPSLVPPLPFQPPPPSVIPPLIPSPPPASMFPPLPFPPLPGVIPSPPPPPPPAFPIPLPPLTPPALPIPLPPLPPPALPIPLPPLPPMPGLPIPPASNRP